MLRVSGILCHSVIRSLRGAAHGKLIHIGLLPRITAPAFSRFSTASALKVRTKISKIFQEQVVRVPWCRRCCSLIAKGTRPSLAAYTRLLRFFSVLPLPSCDAFSRSTVTSPVVGIFSFWPAIFIQNGLRGFHRRSLAFPDPPSWPLLVSG